MIGVQTEPCPPSGGLRALYAADSPHQQLVGLGSLKQTISGKNAELCNFNNKRPSIKFEPSLDGYLARVKRLDAERRQKGIPCPDLPAGFPLSITGERTWSGRDLVGSSEFVVQLSELDVAEIDAALTHFYALSGNHGPNDICEQNFPLPELGPRLKQMSQDLHFGRGVVVLRGLNPDKYNEEQNLFLYIGVLSYFGDRLGVQEEGGSLLTHIVDMGYKFGKNSKRSQAFSSVALPYHNDVCDILAMYVQDNSCEGGRSMIAPSATVYNELASTRPDLIQLLAAPVWVNDKERVPLKWIPRPILFSEPDHGPFFLFTRQKLTGTDIAPLSPEVPPMTEQQAEALDAIHFLAEKHSLKMDLEKGDLVFINNFAVMHGREAFVTNPETSSEPALGGRRHILRLWARNTDLAWKTPQALQNDWFLVYGNSERRERGHWRVSKDDVEFGRVMERKQSCN